jgi:hypothetical protein
VEANNSSMSERTPHMAFHTSFNLKSYRLYLASHLLCQEVQMLYLLWVVVIGILAGWIAGKIMKGRGFGVLGDLVVGIVGALIGSFVFG